MSVVCLHQQPLPPAPKRAARRTNLPCTQKFLTSREDIREINIHVYDKRQTSDSSWEFLREKNKQMKTVQNNPYGENSLETTYFGVEVINSKRRLSGKLGHVVQIHVCRLA